jgi:hypothetical protein
MGEDLVGGARRLAQRECGKAGRRIAYGLAAAVGEGGERVPQQRSRRIGGHKGCGAR